MHSPPVVKRHIAPEKVLALGFLVVIIIGALLLMLPTSAADGRSLGVRSAMFTATSAVCVTGLTIVDAGTQLSLFGQIVLLMLIQVGGLGFMAFATFILVVLRKRLSLKGRLMLRDSMNQEKLSGMVRLSLAFFSMALIIELTGAVILCTRLIPRYGVARGIWYSVFTSVSAFCNAGFDLFGGGRSLLDLQREPVVLITLSGLIVLGGLGFPVISECVDTRMQLKKMSLHARIVLLMTGSLLALGTLCILLLEWDNASTLGSLPFGHKLTNSLFQSVTFRTAGFAGIDQAALCDSSKLIGVVLMLIGASSASTGGGVKTTTAAMLLLSVISVVRGHEHINLFGRRLPNDTPRRALAIVFIAVVMIFASTCAISVIERSAGFDMLDLLFETTSAVSTTGLSSIGTGALSAASQWLLMPLMYLGRVGPLTLAFALADRMDSLRANRVHYPEEKIMIG